MAVSYLDSFVQTAVCEQGKKEFRKTAQEEEAKVSFPAPMPVSSPPSHHVCSSEKK